MTQDVKCFAIFAFWWVMVISIKALPFIISKHGKAHKKRKDKPIKLALTKWDLLLLLTMLITVFNSPENMIEAYIAASKLATIIL